MFWDALRIYASSVTQPWIVMGDFNDLALSSERKGGSGSCLDRIMKFRERMGDCDLMDPGCIGGVFTFIRRVHGRVILQERLDRLLWNEEAVLAFPEGKVFTLPRFCSDHNPIMFSSHDNHIPNKEARPFCFEAAWLTHDGFDRSIIFKECWSKAPFSLPDAIKSLTEGV
nr:reverse transcriptase [Solanum melongena]WMB97092.1 reverse transcriptase [Solanum aethiopicum]